IVVNGVKQPPNSGQLISATKLHLGAPYSDAGKNQAIDSLQDLVRQNGFYYARIHVQTTFQPDSATANLTFSINSGDRAHFTDLFITGQPERSYNSIVRSTGWKRLYGLRGWHEVTEARVDRGLENLRHYYDKRDRLQSQVSLSRLDLVPSNNAVRPSLYMEAGPRVVLSVEGVRIGRGRLNELVPIFREKSVDPDLLAQGDRNIEDYLQSEGYFEA